jgi:hypothetical protein
MTSQVHRWRVEGETPLPPARSGRRWSWRSMAGTMRAIFPGGSLRHRDLIFFRWPRSRPATKVSVWRDSGSAHWQASVVPSAGSMANFPAALRRSQPRSSRTNPFLA